MESNYSAEQALADAQATRATTADHIPTAWWYHGLVGLGEGMVVAGVAAVHTLALALPLMAGGIGLVLWAGRLYQRRQGVWPSFRNGSRQMRIGWITYAVALVALFIGALGLRLAHAPVHLGWFLAAWTVLTVTGLGFAFDAQVRRDIKAGTR